MHPPFADRAADLLLLAAVGGGSDGSKRAADAAAAEHRSPTTLARALCEDVGGRMCEGR